MGWFDNANEPRCKSCGKRVLPRKLYRCEECYPINELLIKERVETDEAYEKLNAENERLQHIVNVWNSYRDCLEGKTRPLEEVLGEIDKALEGE